MSITDLGTTPPDLTGYHVAFGADAGTPVRYVAPAPSYGGAWVDPAFDDSAWAVGPYQMAFPATATLWPPNMNMGPGYTIATRFVVPFTPGAGYLQLAADDRCDLWIDGAFKVTKASPASERWYAVTAGEFSAGDVVALWGEDTLGNQRSVALKYWVPSTDVGHLALGMALTSPPRMMSPNDWGWTRGSSNPINLNLSDLQNKADPGDVVLLAATSGGNELDYSGVGLGNVTTPPGWTLLGRREQFGPSGRGVQMTVFYREWDGTETGSMPINYDVGSGHDHMALAVVYKAPSGFVAKVHEPAFAMDNANGTSTIDVPAVPIPQGRARRVVLGAGEEPPTGTPMVVWADTDVVEDKYISDTSFGTIVMGSSVEGSPTAPAVVGTWAGLTYWVSAAVTLYSA